MNGIDILYVLLMPARASFHRWWRDEGKTWRVSADQSTPLATQADLAEAAEVLRTLNVRICKGLLLKLEGDHGRATSAV